MRLIAVAFSAMSFGIRALPFVLAVLSPRSIAAEGTRAVPTKLFGFTLGAVYDLSNLENGDLTGVPIKKFAGVNRFLGQGISLYFQPKEENKFFEYVEKRKNPEDKYFETTFRAYMLPVLPTTIKSIDELELVKSRWEVALVEWYDDRGGRDDAYYWASDLCRTFSASISAKPEIIDYYDMKNYTCTFVEGDREFKISSYPNKSVRLEYKREVAEAKDQAIENTMRRLLSKQILPE